MEFIPDGPKKQKQLTGNSHSTAFVFLDHAVAHLAHPAHQAHLSISMLDCPNDFHIEIGSFSAFKKNGLHRDGRTDGPTDGPTDRRTRPHIEMRGRI